LTPTRRALGLVAVGGALGALARYGLLRAFPVGAGTFPTTTFVINVVGAFVLTVLLELLLRRGTPEHWLRMFAGVGVLGAFTTFSTFATELALLWRDHERAIAIEYAVGSVVAGVLAVFLGLLVTGWRRAIPLPDEGES
jgi:fluoride exporter